MIDPASLRSLTPQVRASMIYAEAKSAMSDRLWRAALATSTTDAASSVAVPPAPTSMDDLLRLVLTLEDEATKATPVADPASPSTVPVASSPSSPLSCARAAPHHLDTGGVAVATAARVGGLGVNARYAPMLDAAAERTGIPAAALAAIVDAEAGKTADGGWQMLSRNPRSSAAGLGQFLSRTWEGLAETPGTWLNATARANGWLDAKAQVTPQSRAALLALRYRPDAAIEGIADFAHRNLAGMERAGVSAKGEVGATARLAYLGHHLGLGDAIRFLRNGGLDDARARRLLTAQIGGSRSETRIANTGDASIAHRDWLLSFLDRKIQPARYTANV